MNEALLNLPWQIQVALASGGAAYLLAYRGLRAAHTAFDATFITLIFSLIASAMLYLLSAPAEVSQKSWIHSPLLSCVVALTVSCIAAIVWRKVLRGLLAKMLKVWKISWSNDDPSAIATVTLDEGCDINQIQVNLDDDTVLRCDDPELFKNMPYGPVTFGSNGDVVFYLTEEITPDKQRISYKHEEGAFWGNRITCVPSNRIRTMSLLVKKKGKKHPPKKIASLPMVSGNVAVTLKATKPKNDVPPPPAHDN